MVSARPLLNKSITKAAYKYIAEFKAVILDSGAFGSAFWDGGYTYTTKQYLELVERIKPAWWVTMDYPCEPNIIPDMSTEERILKTVENTKALSTAPFPGFLPVIQGWEIPDYLHCADLLEREGLIRPVMGIGSICRRGSQKEIVRIVGAIKRRLSGVKFHAFGIKYNTIQVNNGEILNYLHSLDTAAWQFNEKDELGGWKPRSIEELKQRLASYRNKLESVIQHYQITL